MRGAEWVTSRDAAFFFLEGPTTPYHVASLLTVEGPPIPHQRIVDAIAGKLPRVPRFRQRLQQVPLIERAVWVDDAHLDLDYHVRRATVPFPGTQLQLNHLAAELMEEHLNRFRPLWELWVLDGLASGDTALLLKVHHSLVDGMTGAHDLEILFDSSRRPRSGPPEPWAPRPAPSSASLVASAARDAMAAPLAGLRAAGGLATRPRDVARWLMTGVAGAAAVAGAGLSPAPPCPINCRIGPNRAVDVVRASLRDFKDVKDALGGTVNDVVLAVTSGGLRAWLLSRGENVDGLVLRALVPVSLRPPGDSSSAGNRVAGVVAPLPVHEADPVWRLHMVSKAMVAAKSSRQVAGSSMLLELPALLPASVTRRVAAFQEVQRFFNLSLTNVRGPERPLYLCGHRVLDVVPLAPLSANTALIVGAMSYAGSMDFGLMSDAEAVPDLGLVAEGIEKSIQELVNEAGGAP